MAWMVWGGGVDFYASGAVAGEGIGTAGSVRRRNRGGGQILGPWSLVLGFITRPRCATGNVPGLAMGRTRENVGKVVDFDTILEVRFNAKRTPGNDFSTIFSIGF